ncbi:hypothetical protein F2Q68_00046296 [Brassica cretica]|uniref:Uncharacterized protein n=1 Tax=Brassica cretica TaxID=69181 RepID=A0A8S9LM52_BRACR|nr:hypothetical protein F2Q68_00046296 [Brassica cretica]
MLRVLNFLRDIAEDCSLAVLEGIAIGINPNYKVLGSTYPWIARKILTDSSPQLKTSLQSLLYEDGVFRIDRLESLVTESLRTETALVQKPVEGTDSKIVMKQILSFTFTEQGSFVREILLREFAKVSILNVYQQSDRKKNILIED